MSDERKRCPFCGRSGTRAEYENNQEGGVWFGQCWWCGARGPTAKYLHHLHHEQAMEEAIAGWNRRAEQ